VITAQAIRFTDNVPAMQRFCEALGLAASVTSGDGWAVMRSSSGDVLLHSTADAVSKIVPGQTDLTFETDDLDRLAAEFEVTPVDEAFGRSLSLTDPLGDVLLVNETQTDFYGYSEHDAQPDPAVAVCPVRFTDPSGPYAEFLRRLGLRGEAAGDSAFVAFAADHGTVGLHVARPGEFEQYLTGAEGARVHLTFTTSGDPEALAATLQDQGYAVRIDTTFGTMLEIEDPDGQKVQVHAVG